MNVLPDSRTTTIATPKGAVPSVMGYMVPIYCGSCGTPGGMVPQENMNFVFWLCKECFGKHGEITNTYVMPDEVYWQRLKDEQMEKHGRLLAAEELLQVVAADASPLATLIKEGR